ncbi:MAG: aminodeoxychorismate/anthranilate synthase component II [Bacteroidota bacterium]
MKILVFDNYDSFTYNLVHIITELGFGGGMEIHRNDKLPLEEVERFDKILLSPGPGIPSEAGELLPLIKKYAASKSILGICLGHQAIAEAFGGNLFNLDEVLHGMGTPIYVKDHYGLLADMPAQFLGARYHSWAVEKTTLPNEFIITAEDNAGQIMGLRHREFDVQGLQFHPESIITSDGKKMIANWLEIELRTENYQRISMSST